MQLLALAESFLGLHSGEREERRLLETRDVQERGEECVCVPGMCKDTGAFWRLFFLRGWF